ncbi:MAG: hypothetical protein UY47_C0003G0030 [Parcubacteria group bacterium GW2011_GWB1_49_7]|nr:MAG: hypothetical protein UX28_C0004G0030 [Candidatus Pacebacteria bacterium GW2011_GWA1_46_10]KKW09942.1 MAG: hypothetical protein UY47_C0003G0030 [Parcubacteria group bacterium GW2011_GWB1_49_7]
MKEAIINFLETPGTALLVVGAAVALYALFIILFTGTKKD